MAKSIYTKEYSEFLRKLKQARIDADLTQEEVANRLKKPQSYISKVESGERRIDIVELQKIAKLYRKSISFFES